MVLLSLRSRSLLFYICISYMICNVENKYSAEPIVLKKPKDPEPQQPIPGIPLFDPNAYQGPPGLKKTITTTTTTPATEQLNPAQNMIRTVASLNPGGTKGDEVFRNLFNLAILDGLLGRNRTLDFVNPYPVPKVLSAPSYFLKLENPNQAANPIPNFPNFG